MPPQISVLLHPISHLHYQHNVICSHEGPMQPLLHTALRKVATSIYSANF